MQLIKYTKFGKTKMVPYTKDGEFEGIPDVFVWVESNIDMYAAIPLKRKGNTVGFIYRDKWLMAEECS